MPTIKQVYNARYIHDSSIRDNNTEMHYFMITNKCNLIKKIFIKNLKGSQADNMYEPYELNLIRLLIHSFIFKKKTYNLLGM